MSTKPKTSNVTSLLAAIQRKGPSSSEPTTADSMTVTDTIPVGNKTRRGDASTASLGGRVGKPVQFWRHDEDRQLVRELAAWLAGQGIRSTDSMVIRAALRTAKTGGELLDAYRQAAQLDGRLKHHKVS
jgi:hypothetical protein